MMTSSFRAKLRTSANRCLAFEQVKILIITNYRSFYYKFNHYCKTYNVKNFKRQIHTWARLSKAAAISRNGNRNLTQRHSHSRLAQDPSRVFHFRRTKLNSRPSSNALGFQSFYNSAYQSHGQDATIVGFMP